MGGQSQKRRVGVAREREMVRLAELQHGVVAQQQLEALGFTRRAIERRLDSWRLRMVHGGVYAVGHSKLSPHGRWMAAVLAYGNDALLSHRSAAALWGFARLRAHAIDVTAPVGWQGVLRRKGIWIHRCRLHPEDRTARDGIPVPTVARTLFDLAEVIDLRRLERTWEEADRLGLLHLRAVERVCERGYGRRALRPIRRLLVEARAPTFTRSPLEDRFVAFCREHQLPQPATNALVLGFEVDALWPTQRLVVELDGFAYHRHRAAFERDRARDTALQVAGYRVIRLTHRRLSDDAENVAREIRTCLSLTTNMGA
jgi:very-short-patch-repair endonuclease